MLPENITHFGPSCVNFSGILGDHYYELAVAVYHNALIREGIYHIFYSQVEAEEKILRNTKQA